MPFSAVDLERLKAELIRELKMSITSEIVGEIVTTLNAKFLGKEPQAAVPAEVHAASLPPRQYLQVSTPLAPTAAERIGQVDAFEIKKEKAEVPVWRVSLGATRAEGGTTRADVHGRRRNVHALPSLGRGNAVPAVGRHGSIRRGE